MKGNKHLGSDFDNFLKEEGALSGAEAVAAKRVIKEFEKRLASRTVQFISANSLIKKIEKKRKLEKAGWKIGTAKDFLGLSRKENEIVGLLADIAKAEKDVKEKKLIPHQKVEAMFLKMRKEYDFSKSVKNPYINKLKNKNRPLPRCPWVDITKPDYVAYHDEEWGVPVRDDRKWFEFLTLESAQAGLSWYTVLRKRGNYRRAFSGFDPRKVAAYDEKKMRSLLADPGIIRNRAKIAAAIHNARSFLEIRKEFGSFDAYIWRFVNGKPIVNSIRSLKDYAATSPESDALSLDLRKRGFKFVGSTICYAHMQATGMINDHVRDCFRRKEIVRRYPKSKF